MCLYLFCYNCSTLRVLHQGWNSHTPPSYMISHHSSRKKLVSNVSLSPSLSLPPSLPPSIPHYSLTRQVQLMQLSIFHPPLSINTALLLHIPVQSICPLVPGHRHLKFPLVFLHTEPSTQLCMLVAHSSTSENKTIPFIILVYISPFNIQIYYSKGRVIPPPS